MKICCFTGHRHIEADHMRYLPSLVEQEILRLIESRVRVFRNGGAIGFDTLAALSVIAIRERHPEIELEMVLPCRNQDLKWTPRQREEYAYILAHADRIRYISEHYTHFCMLERDRRMVDGSDVCVAYCLRTAGGTGYTCQYALKHGVEIHNLARQLPRR